MRTRLIVSAFVLAGMCGMAASAPVWTDDPRTPEAIVADLDAAKLPEFDASKRSDQAYLKEYTEKRAAVTKKRADLALELFQAKPDHPKAVELMRERWSTLPRTGAEGMDAVIAETKTVSEGSGPLAGDAGYYYASSVAAKNQFKAEDSLPAIDAFAKRWPSDDRAVQLLSQVAGARDRDGKERMEPAKKIELLKRILKDYPRSQSAKYVKGEIRQTEGVGKPFDLAFMDIVTGGEVDISKSKGTIFVIDFWATWCGPCVAEMPKNKELYAKFKGQGVQFIGVSLDFAEYKGGKKKLLDYVKSNDIQWPQYYQGNYWESEFSVGWGINSIPALFVVDADGNLFSTEARGKLETMLPELIEKRDKKKN